MTAVSGHGLPWFALTRDGWSLFADRPGKYGWISHGAPGATLELDVAFGPDPRLTLVYDRSYIGFGDASVEIKGGRVRLANGTVSRMPAVARRMSGTRTDGLNLTTADVLLVYGRSFGFLPNATQTVVVTALTPDKFKLRAVTSC